MSSELVEWILLILRWIHITTAMAWIGTSFFFMWLDRSFIRNQQSTTPGHVGELWMVHGGGFYHVEKMLLGPAKVPELLHWFKWESYWTWMSGAALIFMIFYRSATYLVDPSIADLSYMQAAGIGLFAIFGSWFFYDTLWERKFARNNPLVGNLITITWLVGMTILLCKTLSGRAAYIHIGAMIGTWMTGNVFLRIIPRMQEMVRAAKEGQDPNPDWAINAKNRSSHNTYLTLPVIFIMISNHFPTTYGHSWNWLMAIILCVCGALIRAYFVFRLSHPGRAKQFAVVGCLGIVLLIASTLPRNNQSGPVTQFAGDTQTLTSTQISGRIIFEGKPPEPRRLDMPGCNFSHEEVWADDVLVKDEGLQNTVIYISKGLEGQAFAPAKSILEMDQVGCIYKPRIVGVQTRQEIVFINSDPVFHNVRSVSLNNENFNLIMPQKNQRITQSFANPEQFIEAKCDVHPWMKAWIGVFDHPFFAISSETGIYSIKGLKSGTYTLTAWHEVYGEQHVEIEIGQDDITHDFTFRALEEP